ncbi:hypothetical protein [Sphingopyxis sp.]|uniref:hypothetical protein n=1 Tax=Sphingopyxis sp. TaxID=1908224 RepID=UPI001DEFD710|nr:hypothetical protein [Sphingopyxis sp.]MBW8296572.1 hypothetical protein [Sphingopyxis sp.]
MMRALSIKSVWIPDRSAVSAAYRDSFASDRLELGIRVELDVMMVCRLRVMESRL